MCLRIFLLLLTSSFSLYAQSYYDIAQAKTGQLSFEEAPIIGLWAVERVQVGTEEMTPTAKWFEFIENGKLTGGNGGITNIRGSWRYDTNNKQLEQLNGGQADPYGPFNVEFSQGQMFWERFEDGQKVKVSLFRVVEKPLAPWDLIIGEWFNDKAEGFDKETNQIRSVYAMTPNSFYFGWDGRYRKYDQEGNRIETGIWHIEAHSPWLWLINDEGSKKVGWSIDIRENQMTWTNSGETETLKVYFERSND